MDIGVCYEDKDPWTEDIHAFLPFHSLNNIRNYLDNLLSTQLLSHVSFTTW